MGLGKEFKRFEEEFRKKRKNAPWAPVADLVHEASMDQEAALVLNDWCAERNIYGGAAWLLWSLTRPTEYQIGITFFVIGRETVAANYPWGQRKAPLRDDSQEYRHLYLLDYLPEDSSSMQERERLFGMVDRQLKIHQHSRWIRVVSRLYTRGPIGNETVMQRVPFMIASQMRDCVRTRCRSEDCLQLSVEALPLLAPLGAALAFRTAPDAGSRPEATDEGGSE